MDSSDEYSEEGQFSEDSEEYSEEETGDSSAQEEQPAPNKGNTKKQKKNGAGVVLLTGIFISGARKRNNRVKRGQVVAIEQSKEEEAADHEFRKAAFAAREAVATDYSEMMLAMLVWLLVLFALVRFTPLGDQLQIRKMLDPALKVMTIPFLGLLFYASYDTFFADDI